MAPSAEPLPNPTVLGVAPPRWSDVEAAAQRVRFAKGTTPPPAGPREQRGPADAADVAEAAPSSRWKPFQDIGLAPSPLANKASKLVVSSYRLLGFAILTLIVIVLVGYIATTAFYFFSHSWITPVAISASDEKVVALQTQLAAEQGRRDAIADDLAQADRAIAAEQSFQLGFARAIAHDLEGRKLALDRVRGLAQAAAAARADIRRTNDAYAASSKRRMQDELAAGLIDRHDMLAGKFQLAQISSSSLSLAERQGELEQRQAELTMETKALDAILGDGATSAELSYEVLQIKRQYEASKLALAKEIQARDTLKAGLARQDKILDAVKHSAYLRAVTDHATIAFVPYGNLDNAGKGTRLYSCRAAMMLCRKVGTVVDVLPGEVAFKHPHRDKVMRGQMVELTLDAAERSAAEDDVLFAGGAPLWL